MPIFDFKCKKCGYLFEKTVRTADTVPPDCPKCNEPDTTKLIGASTFILKGENWFKNSGSY